MAALLSNNATSTLTASINTAVTEISIVADDAAKFPVPGAGEWFPVSLVDESGNMEILRCTGRSGAILTVERAQEGTVAQSFASGSRVDLRFTKAVLSEINNVLGEHDEAISAHQTKLGEQDTKLEEHQTALDEDATALGKRISVDAPQAFTAAQKGQAIANLGGDVLVGYRDKIINGDGQISQRTYTTVADDNYWCDRHYVLTQTAAITPTIITDIADGLPFMMRLAQSQATAQRMGNAQIVEASVSKRMRGKKVTLGGTLRCSSAQAIRYAVLEWTGTVDTVTSDVVADWTSGSYTAGGFFLGANLVVAGVGAVTPASNTLTDWSLVADISSACNNLVVIYWAEGAAAQNVTLDMAWGLVEGDASAEKWPYGVRHPEQELNLCQRFYEVVELASAALAMSPLGGTTHSSSGYVSLWFKVVKRATPTVVPSGSTGVSSLAIVPSRDCARFGGTATSSGMAINGPITIDAEL